MGHIDVFARRPGLEPLTPASTHPAMDTSFTQRNAASRQVNAVEIPLVICQTGFSALGHVRICTKGGELVARFDRQGMGH